MNPYWPVIGKALRLALCMQPCAREAGYAPPCDAPGICVCGK